MASSKLIKMSHNGFIREATFTNCEHCAYLRVPLHVGSLAGVANNVLNVTAVDYFKWEIMCDQSMPRTTLQRQNYLAETGVDLLLSIAINLVLMEVMCARAMQGESNAKWQI